jgi:hypothetical protein
MREAVTELIHHELNAEESSGFQLLRSIPSTESKRFLRVYEKLSRTDRENFKQATSIMSCSWFGIPSDPVSDEVADFWKKFAELRLHSVSWEDWGARGLRTLRGMRDAKVTDADFSSLPPEALEKIESIETAKAPALRKSAKKIFSEYLNATVEKRSGGCCVYTGALEGIDVSVRIDYGGRAQLVYGVKVPSVSDIGHRLTYEGVHGFGTGVWDFIEEGQDELAMLTLCEAIRKIVDLASRVSKIR